MTAKQLNGLYAPDQAKYACLVDGDGSLVSISTTTLGSSKQVNGSQSPDGSVYMTITNGNGTLS